MKPAAPPHRPSFRSPGITLLELVVVITVLMVLISVLFLGATAWKAGSDRSNCLVNIRNVQLAGRSYQNMYAINPGENFTDTMIIGPNSYIPQVPVCPGDGTYTYATTFPVTGTLFITCSVASHVPPSYSGW